LQHYVIRDEDVAGPFQSIPRDMLRKARLKTLSYQSAVEALGERFHCSPKLLEALNPGIEVTNPGQGIAAPNVDGDPLPEASTVVIDRSDSAVYALDPNGNVLAHFPASVGSEHDPLPVGRWKILGKKRDPIFHYNPDLFWDADPSHSRAEIAPGPNNPVGVVWIALSKPHYGIHGTPEPSKIGYTQSHGCIRLTNWDASKLADMVRPGTPAILQE
jgi:lipoprotein-anchoring transpeptidase ErfK/SrfK